MSQEPDRVEDESATMIVADLRGYIRHACRRKPLLRLLAKPSFVCLEARVADVSATGIALIHHRRLKPGTDLAILLRHERPERCRILRADVVHTVPLTRGQWRMGCNIHGGLSDDEILALLS